MTPTVLSLAVALFFQPNDPREVYVLIRIQPVNICESQDAARQFWATLARHERTMRAALAVPEVAALLRNQPRPEQWLAENLKADWPGEGDILRLRLRTAKRSEAALLLNAVADAFLRVQVEPHRQWLPGCAKDLQRCLDMLRQRIDEGEKEWRGMPDSPERLRLRGTIEARRSSVHETEMQVERLDRAAWLGWPYATVVRRAP